MYMITSHLQVTTINVANDEDNDIFILHKEIKIHVPYLYMICKFIMIVNYKKIFDFI